MRLARDLQMSQRNAFLLSGLLTVVLLVGMTIMRQHLFVS